MKTSNFTYLVKRGIQSVWYNRMMSFACFCIIMVSLLIIGLSVLLGANVNIILRSIENRNEILVYMKTTATPEQMKAEEEFLKASPYVAKGDTAAPAIAAPGSGDSAGGAGDTAGVTQGVMLYTKEQAWYDYEQKYANYSVLFKYMQTLHLNPFPDTYRVKIADISQISEASKAFAPQDDSSPVESVTAPQDFAEGLITLRATFTFIGIAVLIALIVVCLVIIYNASSSSVFARRTEINIMKYVGATNSFIRIPFFVEGIFIGVVSGLVSWLLTRFAYDAVLAQFNGNVTIWHVLGFADLIPYNNITLFVLVANCLLGAALGASGTLVSMGKHLKV
ncbi:cell division protein [Clostridia bacterium]|nr:cell division protein [Clostridia bacterium]